MKPSGVCLRCKILTLIFSVSFSPTIKQFSDDTSQVSYSSI